MAVKVINANQIKYGKFIGSVYKRKDGSFRNRNSGNVFVADKLNVITAKGKNDRVIFPTSAKLLGREKSKFHFSGLDSVPILIKNKTVTKDFKDRRRSQQERAAMFRNRKRKR